MKNHIQICTGFLSYVHFIMDKGRDVGMGEGLCSTARHMLGVFFYALYCLIFLTL